MSSGSANPKRSRRTARWPGRSRPRRRPRAGVSRRSSRPAAAGGRATQPRSSSRPSPVARACDVDDDQLGHLVEALVGGVGELDEAEHVEAVDRRVHDVITGPAARPSSRRAPGRRTGLVVVAGGQQDRSTAPRCRRRRRRCARAPRARRAWRQVAVREVVQHLGVHDRVALEQRGPAPQPVAGEVADQGVDEVGGVDRDDHAVRRCAPVVDEGSVGTPKRCLGTNR